MSERFPTFEYLHFAKYGMGGSRFPLCLSGVPDASLEDFTSPEDRAAHIGAHELATAFPRWRELISARYGVPAAHAYPTVGTSGAVFLALSALLSREARGATVAIEALAYGIFESVARFLGARTVPVDRSAAKRFAVDLEGAERALRDGARIVCVTDLHNPSGVRLSDAEIASLRELAVRHGAWALVDEVYRDFLPGRVATAYRPGDRVVACGSFTKCYGLGGLRAGWVFGPPEVIERVELVEELSCGVQPSPTAFLAVRALEHADALLERGRAFAAAGRPIADAWIASTPHVSWVAPAAGITGLVKVDGVTDSTRFSARLREELDCQLVPGAFFGAEGHVRISFGRAPADVRAALDVLALGIGALRD